ncbi:glycosyltransferase, partial [bacterium]|nr:glycosyltransferase [bacterium]
MSFVMQNCSISQSEPVNNIMISAIIPTYNRSELLRISIESILKQSFPESEYEIIVVDNNSTDSTKKVVSNVNQTSGNQIHYVFEPNPGLVNARHRGAREAEGDILVFCDDDIIASPEWLTAISEAFNDPDVALVGGKVLPKYEVPLPHWINAFWQHDKYGSWIMYLSLIDLGDSIHEVPANYVFGCNFSIRKHVLYECGGFHPDSFPRDMIRYRGDGEYGLALAIMQKGYRTVYHPGVSIEHQVPKERMTVEYFCQRAFYEGISNSYTEIRKKVSLVDKGTNHTIFIKDTDQFAFGIINGTLQLEATSLPEIQKLVRYSCEQGKLYHRNQVLADPELLAYVLRKDYLKDSVSLPGRKHVAKTSMPYRQANLSNIGKTAEAILSQRAKLLCNEGERLFGECRFLEALAKFDEAMYLNPRVNGLQYRRAVCLLSAGRISEAEIASLAELKVKPEFKPASSLLESLHEVSGLGKILAIPTQLTFAERMLLHRLAQQIPSKGVIVEIGSYVGASSSFLAEGARKNSAHVFCIDTWQ